MVGFVILNCHVLLFPGSVDYWKEILHVVRDTHIAVNKTFYSVHSCYLLMELKIILLLRNSVSCVSFASCDIFGDVCK